MLYNVLSFLATVVSLEFRRDPAVKGDMAIVDRVMELGGTVAETDHIVISLLNIEQETSLRNSPTVRVTGSQAERVSMPIHLNISVLVSACFKNYAESIKALSKTILFFQGHTVFLSDEYPALDSSIDKLVVDLQSPSLQEWNNIWGMHGGKSVPSVLYKVRLLTIQDGLSKGSVPLIRTITQAG